MVIKGLNTLKVSVKFGRFLTFEQYEIGILTRFRLQCLKSYKDNATQGIVCNATI